MHVEELTGLTWNSGYFTVSASNTIKIVNTGTGASAGSNYTVISGINNTQFQCPVYYATVVPFRLDGFDTYIDLPCAVWTDSNGIIKDIVYHTSDNLSPKALVINPSSYIGNGLRLYINSSTDNITETHIYKEKDVTADNLVFDRSEADVTACKEYAYNIMANGFPTETAYYTKANADKMVEYLSGHPGAYNYTDMNRVGKMCVKLHGQLYDYIYDLENYAYNHGISPEDMTTAMKMPYTSEDVEAVYDGLNPPKRNWKVEDIPTQTQIATYLGIVEAIRTLVEDRLPSTTPTTPTSLDKMTISKANAIERILYDVWYVAIDIYNDAKAAIDAAAQ